MANKYKPEVESYGKRYDFARPAQNRPPATSSGVRQVVSLARLPTIEKCITINEDEVVLSWRLKAPDDLRALKMMLLLYEANGWIVESAVKSKSA